MKNLYSLLGFRKNCQVKTPEINDYGKILVFGNSPELRSTIIQNLFGCTECSAKTNDGIDQPTSTSHKINTNFLCTLRRKRKSKKIDNTKICITELLYIGPPKNDPKEGLKVKRKDCMAKTMTIELVNVTTTMETETPAFYQVLLAEARGFILAFSSTMESVKFVHSTLKNIEKISADSKIPKFSLHFKTTDSATNITLTKEMENYFAVCRRLGCKKHIISSSNCRDTLVGLRMNFINELHQYNEIFVDEENRTIVEDYLNS